MASSSDGHEYESRNRGTPEDPSGFGAHRQQLAAPPLEDGEPAVGLDVLEERQTQLKPAVLLEFLTVVGEQRLEGDPAVREDARRIRNVRRQDLETLSACYRG